jgi:hypothetical protein
MLAAAAVGDDRVVAPAALMATSENEAFLPGRSTWPTQTLRYA